MHNPPLFFLHTPITDSLPFSLVPLNAKKWNGAYPVGLMQVGQVRGGGDRGRVPGMRGVGVSGVVSFIEEDGLALFTYP